MELELVSVYHDMGAIPFLYDLLRERDFDSVTLSHRVMPMVAEHIEFVMSKPYEAWYIIMKDKWQRIGQIYLSKRNEIGIFVSKECQRQGVATWAIKKLRCMHGNHVDEFYANINPLNEPSIKLFASLGFRDYQYTMRFRGDGNYGHVLPRFEERVHERPEGNEGPPDPRPRKPPPDSEEAASEQGEVSRGLEALWRARALAHARVREGGP